MRGGLGRAKQAPASHTRADCPLSECAELTSPSSCFALAAACLARWQPPRPGRAARDLDAAFCPPACQAFKRPLCAQLVGGKAVSSPRQGTRRRPPPPRGPGRASRGRPSAPVVLAGASAAANGANERERVRISCARASFQTALAASPRRAPPNVARLARPRGEADRTATARSARRRRGRVQGTVMPYYVKFRGHNFANTVSRLLLTVTVGDARAEFRHSTPITGPLAPRPASGSALRTVRRQSRDSRSEPSRDAKFSLAAPRRVSAVRLSNGVPEFRPTTFPVTFRTLLMPVPVGPYQSSTINVAPASSRSCDTVAYTISQFLVLGSYLRAVKT